MYNYKSNIKNIANLHNVYIFKRKEQKHFNYLHIGFWVHFTYLFFSFSRIVIQNCIKQEIAFLLLSFLQYIFNFYPFKRSNLPIYRIFYIRSFQRFPADFIICSRWPKIRIEIVILFFFTLIHNSQLFRGNLWFLFLSQKLLLALFL